ncbi:uncharacterized protein LOC127840882 isoform X2 [Dreissena polymorpha]|uniref:TIR domain-containing protein n=1 Tax=Dreissena polymorpha TaxID=45954 RepID=A0A9D4N2Q1_DREPO|nr:uncharacterized protein LOC127840882 isoform X2 [Dreissena polymorpha]KAH3885702.1 hypothetical protein DPMN_009698 [Dreissena polymorpha]
MASGEINAKVIILYDSEGANETSKKEADNLRFFIEKNGGYTCQTDDKIMIAGTEDIKTFHNSINHNDRIIILITDQSVTDKSVNQKDGSLADLSALVKNMVENHMILLVAYKGNRREDIGFLKTGLLSLTPKTFIDLNKWQGYQKLLKQLKNSPGSKKEGYTYDVFLMHVTEDKKITETIYNVLTEAGLICAADFGDGKCFPFGRPVSESIRRLVRESRTSVLVLTKTAVESPWINLETIHALEESKYRGNQLVFRLLLIDVDEDEVPALKVGCLERLPHFIAKFSEDGWEKKLLDSLNEPLQVCDVLPVGSLAHGLVYSHFTGLLSYMLPTKLREEITKWDRYEEYKDKTCTNFNMLVPKSCKLSDSLSGKDDKSGIEIKHETDLKFSTDHMGKPRVFTISMYRISRGSEFYFFYADMPFVLNCVYELKEKNLAEGVDTNLQCQRFKHTYNTLVNHQEFGRRLNNPLRMLEYDDGQTNRFEVLFEAVKNSVNGPDGEVVANTTVTQPSKSTVAQADQVIDGVYVTCTDDKEDRKIGSDIVDYLSSKNIMAFTDSRDVGPGATMSENYNWYVFVISKKSLKDTAFCFKITQILEDSVHKNTTKLIPVLHKVDIKMVPDLIRWVTMLCTSDSKFCDHIYQTVIGGPVTMVEKMPCGDVVTGLCWAYLINYMKMALFLRTPDNEGSLDFRGRIKAFLLNNNLLCGCLDKVYILWPSSCMITDAIEIVANKNSPDERIVKLGSLPPVYANTGGQRNRPFTFSVYKHTRPHTKQSTCFIAEYCTPMGCLYQMGTKYGFAGINKEDLYSQGQNFMKAFESFTSLPAVKEQLGDFQKHTQFMYYDDSKKPLIEVIEERLSQEKKTQCSQRIVLC